MSIISPNPEPYIQRIKKHGFELESPNEGKLGPDHKVVQDLFTVIETGITRFLTDLNKSLVLESSPHLTKERSIDYAAIDEYAKALFKVQNHILKTPEHSGLLEDVERQAYQTLKASHQKRLEAQKAVQYLFDFPNGIEAEKYAKTLELNQLNAKAIDKLRIINNQYFHANKSRNEVTKIALGLAQNPGISQAPILLNQLVLFALEKSKSKCFIIKSHYDPRKNSHDMDASIDHAELDPFIYAVFNNPRAKENPNYASLKYNIEENVFFNVNPANEDLPSYEDYDYEAIGSFFTLANKPFSSKEPSASSANFLALFAEGMKRDETKDFFFKNTKNHLPH